MSLSKTISLHDFSLPEVKAEVRALKQFAHQRFWQGDHFAVNGVSKRRWRIRWNKLWEYSRGLAYVPWQKEWKILDFGGGATLPVYYLANEGAEVWSFDIDQKLTAEATALAQKRNWPLHATTQDLTQEPWTGAESSLDWVISFCVLEHLPRAYQLNAAKLLASYLKPGGYMSLTFDYGTTAPVEGAYRSSKEVEDLVQATGLSFVDGQGFSDTGERFVLDKKYPQAEFTFGSLFLKKLN